MLLRLLASSILSVYCVAVYNTIRTLFVYYFYYLRKIIRFIHIIVISPAEFVKISNHTAVHLFSSVIGLHCCS